MGKGGSDSVFNQDQLKRYGDKVTPNSDTSHKRFFRELVHFCS